MSQRVRAACLWIAVLAASVGVSVPTTEAQGNQGRWMNVAPFPDPREELLGAAAAGKLYVFAGLIPLWHPSGVVFEYNPATDQWTKKRPMALPSHHVALTTYNDKIYAFGGFVYPATGGAAWVPIDNAWEYNPATDTWKALAPMPIKRGAAMAATVGDKLYVIGGATTQPWATQNFLSFATPQRVLGTVQEYDPGTNTWRERTAMPSPRNHAAIGVVNNKVYVIGGRVGAAFISLASDVSLVEVYDPATDTWGVPGARMPTTRSALAYGVYGGRIYVAGGEFQDPVQQTTFRAFEAYDPASNTWSIMPPMAIARHGVAAAVVGNRFYAVSGDVQSSGTGVEVSTPVVSAFEFSN
jgi:N-acetylneuraminic acid mutarotase